MKLPISTLDACLSTPFLFVLLALCQCATPALSQDQSVYALREVQINGIRIEGAATPTEEQFLIQTSGLETGQYVSVPGDVVFSEAIRAIYRLGKYENVKIIESQKNENTTDIIIQVQETPRVGSYMLSGIKKGDRTELENNVPLLARTPLKQADVDRTVGIIKKFYSEKGYATASVRAEQRTNSQAQ